MKSYLQDHEHEEDTQGENYSWVEKNYRFGVYQFRLGKVRNKNIRLSVNKKVYKTEEIKVEAKEQSVTESEFIKLKDKLKEYIKNAFSTKEVMDKIDKNPEFSNNAIVKMFNKYLMSTLPSSKDNAEA